MNQVYLIGNAHLDPVWLWRWQEGYAEVMATFRSALDRMKEFDEFVFTCAGAAYYEWIEQTDPAMFEEIRSRIAEGRWVLAGGWWIQPDCNFPCGESFARHSLYSQNYFLKKFGVIATFGYNVDSFGHSAMLPQILKKSGMDAYVFMRPGDTEKDYPFKDLCFLWCSPDGTKLPAYRINESYCTRIEDNLTEKAKNYAGFSDRDGQPVMCFFGVGNHGGGPTIDHLYTIRDLRNGASGERFRIASPKDYFASIDQSRLPVLTGDLQHHAPGCYSTAMPIKQMNRACEARLVSAEASSMVAAGLGLGTPADLQEAWKRVMFQHFHDIMGGCCVKEGVDDALEALGYSKTVAEETQNLAQQRIAWNIDTSKGIAEHLDRQDWRVRDQDGLGTPLIVFNPHPYDATLPVDLMYEYTRVTDDNGVTYPRQSIRGGVTNGNADKYTTYIVADVPAFGWKLFWGYTDEDPAVQGKGLLRYENGVLENDLLAVRVQGGSVVGITDKQTGREMLSGAIEAVVFDETENDTWAHGLKSFDHKFGAFTFSAPDVIEDGAVCTTLRFRGTYEKSSAELKLTLYRELPGAYLDCRINWQEKHRVLKLSVPTAFRDGNLCGIPAGFLRRENTGTEDPMLCFVAATDAAGGLSIATDSRTAYDCTDGTVGLTLLRSPLYTDHFGVRDDRCDSYMAQGGQSFRLQLDAWRDVHTAQRASDALVSPLNAVLGTFHKGKLGAEGTGLTVSADNVLVEAWKPAEDKNGMILRLRETDGTAVSAQITLPVYGTDFTAEFSPLEIKTFRIADGKVTETDLLERPV